MVNCHSYAKKTSLIWLRNNTERTKVQQWRLSLWHACIIIKTRQNDSKSGTARLQNIESTIDATHDMNDIGDLLWATRQMP